MHNRAFRARTGTLMAILAIAVISPVCAQSMFREVNDFDGDGKADFAVTRAEKFLKVWHIWQTTAGYRRVQWGLPADRNASADYDGDGKTDIAVARQTPADNTSFTTYVALSTGPLVFKTVTNPFDVAFFTGPQDYDGDGEADPAVVRAQPGVNALYYLSSAAGVTGTANLPSQVLARIGDLTGDGRAEAASFLGDMGSSTVTFWYRNLATGELRGVPWGLSGDEPVPADFDGDGKGDIAVWRISSGDWWWIRSSDNAAHVSHWGQSGDFPVPADYDGDGKTDHAVYRRIEEPNGIYYINGSQTGFQRVTWGIPTDTLVRY